MQRDFKKITVAESAAPWPLALFHCSSYRVICIDRRPVHGTDLVWNHLPNGAEDETGDRPLEERARWIKHADFFIGPSSGLSCLAWAVETPVVLISGFTHLTNEFHTPYRIINYHACNSCWNDVRVRFDHKNFLWCPRHAGTPRQFKCTRMITGEAVKEMIRERWVHHYHGLEYRADAEGRGQLESAVTR